MEQTKFPEIKFLSEKYDETNVPLYLSYPTTSWWNDAPDEDSFVKSYGPEETPFLYFHFPYCKRACYYCCCYKEVTQSDTKKQIYIEHLKKELALKLDKLCVDRLARVKHMHWGGGTPTYMSLRQIEDIFSAIAEKTDLVQSPDSNISIEAYPDEEMLTIDKLRLIRNLGFNEISFGIQDFDERIQKTINRDCSEETVKKIVGLASELGFRINIDLCYGLPFQGIPELEKTIRRIAEMKPDKIAVFPYAHYPMLFPLQRQIPLAGIPDSFMKILLIQRAGELFTSFGYKRIGIDHFVKPDNPLYEAYCKENVIKDFMGYSTEQRRSFIGFGNSAISFLGNSYFQNTGSIKDYFQELDEHRLPFKNSTMHRLSPDDLVRNELIQKSILCDFAIDKRRISEEFGIDFNDYFNKELTILENYEKDGLVESVNGDRIIVTPLGKYMARHIAYVFDRYYREN
jgi:oxygen-independent coproporphyrinogen-3 oxidase